MIKKQKRSTSSDHLEGVDGSGNGDQRNGGAEASGAAGRGGRHRRLGGGGGGRRLRGGRGRGGDGSLGRRRGRGRRGGRGGRDLGRGRRGRLGRRDRRRGRGPQRRRRGLGRRRGGRARSLRGGGHGEEREDGEDGEGRSGHCTDLAGFLARFSPHVKSPSDYDEEAVNLKAKTSSRKVRKREGIMASDHRGVKESATTEGEQQYGAEQDQEVGSTSTAGVAVLQGRKREGVRQSSPTHDKGQAIDKASSENSAGGLRDKTHKHISVVRDREGRKMATVGTSVVRREGLRRSARISTKEYLDAAEDSTSQLSDTNASEDETEVGNRTSENQNQHKDEAMVDGTLAPDAEIRAMVRDVLFSDIIARQHAAEMAYVDDVINGICDATEENMISGATSATKGGRGIKRSGSKVEAESCNVTHRPRKGKVDEVTSSPNEATEDAMQVTNPETMNYSLKGIIDTTLGCSHGGSGAT